MTGKPANLKGHRYGRLTVVELTGKRTGNGCAIWRCLCDCGNWCEVDSHAMRSGNTRSCGCGNDENRSGIYDRKKPMLDAGSRADTYLSPKPRRDSKTGIRGVCRQRSGRYRARLEFAGELHHLGTYDTLEEAAWARRNAEVEIYDPYLVAHGRPPTSEEEFLDALEKALEKEEER